MGLTERNLRELWAISWIYSPMSSQYSESTRVIMYLNMIYPSVNLSRMIKYRIDREI